MCSVMAGQLFAYQYDIGGAAFRARAKMPYCSISMDYMTLSAKL